MKSTLLALMLLTILVIIIFSVQGYDVNFAIKAVSTCNVDYYCTVDEMGREVAFDCETQSPIQICNSDEKCELTEDRPRCVLKEEGIFSLLDPIATIIVTILLLILVILFYVKYVLKKKFIGK